MFVDGYRIGKQSKKENKGKKEGRGGLCGRVCRRLRVRRQSHNSGRVPVRAVAGHRGVIQIQTARCARLSALVYHNRGQSVLACFDTDGIVFDSSFRGQRNALPALLKTRARLLQRGGFGGKSRDRRY